MCQMCDEYEAELVRMGLLDDARKARTERHGRTVGQVDGPATGISQERPAAPGGGDASPSVRAHDDR